MIEPFQRFWKCPLGKPDRAMFLISCRLILFVESWSTNWRLVESKIIWISLSPAENWESSTVSIFGNFLRGDCARYGKLASFVQNCVWNIMEFFWRKVHFFAFLLKFPDVQPRNLYSAFQNTLEKPWWTFGHLSVTKTFPVPGLIITCFIFYHICFLNTQIFTTWKNRRTNEWWNIWKNVVK